MERCRKCGTKLEDYFDYCPECGLKIIRKNERIREERKRPDSSIFEYNEEKMKQYKICNKKFFFKGIIIGLILIIVGLFIGGFVNYMFGTFLMIAGLMLIFTSNAIGRKSYFVKQSKKIKKGMSIHQVRAMFAFIEPYNEGFDRHNEYTIVYNTNTKRKKNSDYEAVTITFDENAEVVDIERSYKRTTTY